MQTGSCDLLTQKRSRLEQHPFRRLNRDINAIVSRALAYSGERVAAFGAYMRRSRLILSSLACGHITRACFLLATNISADVTYPPWVITMIRLSSFHIPTDLQLPVLLNPASGCPPASSIKVSAWPVKVFDRFWRCPYFFGTARVGFFGVTRLSTEPRLLILWIRDAFGT